jgi:glycosyltransferase involved in cell wall biosynthesis
MAHAVRLWLFMDYAGMFAGRRVEGWLLRNAANWHDAALTISQATAEELRRTTRRPVTCVGWGLSHFERLTPCYLEERPQPEAARLLYVGDDRPRKGMADFLAAAEQVAAGGRAVEIEIVCRTGCTVQTSLPYTLHVAASTETLIELYQSCRCLVMASWAEGLSNPPLEAMACATPVVLTASGGPEEYARDGENCLVVPPRSPEALAVAIARVLDEPELARRLSHAGPVTAAGYRWEPVIDRVEQLLFETTQRRAEASPRRWRSAAR